MSKKDSKILLFPAPAPSKADYQRVKSTYTVQEIKQLFGLSERVIRRWTEGGVVNAALSSDAGEPLYDFTALTQFRRVRELRGQGLTLKQVEAEAGSLLDDALVIRTASVSEGRSVANSIAKALNRRTAYIKDATITPGFAPWLLMSGLLPVFAFDLSPGEKKSIPSLPYYTGPTLAICGPDGIIEFHDETFCRKIRRDMNVQMDHIFLHLIPFETHDLEMFN